MLGVFEAFSERADVPIRTVAYMRHHQVDQTEWRPGDGNDRFTIQGVKLWYDGSPYSGTMLLDEPLPRIQTLLLHPWYSGRHDGARKLCPG